MKQKGFNAHFLKLAKQQRDSIKKDALAGKRVNDIARRHGITRQRVHQIIGSVRELRLNHQADELRGEHGTGTG